MNYLSPQKKLRLTVILIPFFLLRSPLFLWVFALPKHDTTNRQKAIISFEIPPTEAPGKLVLIMLLRMLLSKYLISFHFSRICKDFYYKVALLMINDGDVVFI